MVYTAKNVKELRSIAGSLLEKIANELGLIDTEIDAVETNIDTVEAEIAAGMKVAKVALTGGLADAIAFAWQNPETSKIIVPLMVVDITVAGGTGTAVIDVDVVANATATGNTIFDGIDANATALLQNTNVSDTGTNGNEKAHKVDEKDGSNDYITGKILVEAASALEGYVYIFYTKVGA